MLVVMARYKDACPGMEPSFAICFKGRLYEELKAAGADVHLMGDVKVSRPWTVMRARQRMRQLLQRQPFDWLISHSVWPLVVFGPVLQESDAKLGFWQHDRISGTHWLERWARRRKPALAICNSHFTAETLPNLYPQAPPSVVCYPVTSPPKPARGDSRQRLRAELSTSEESVVLIQASRLEEWKGHRLHLEALARLRDLPHWTSWQVGGPQRPHEHEYYRSLQTMAADLGIADRVRFVGQRSDVADLLAAADIHCQPNTGPEPFGLTFVEALFAGLPVVTTAIGGAKEILDESCAQLAPPLDAGALAELLRGLIQDPDLRRRLGRNGPGRAASLSAPSHGLGQLWEALSRFSAIEAARV